MNIKNNKNCKITINDKELKETITVKLDDGILISKSKIEKTADEMFKELGYKIERKETKIEVEYIDDDDKIIYFDKYRKRILCYNEDDESAEELMLQELQAINKKCKELRLDMMNNTQQIYEVNHTRDEFIKLIGKSHIK